MGRAGRSLQRGSPGQHLLFALSLFRFSLSRFVGGGLDWGIWLQSWAPGPRIPGFGGLALEIKNGRGSLKKLLNRLNHKLHFSCIAEERRILAGYGGGCHQKIGVTVVPSSQGYVTFTRGETQSGVSLDSIKWHSHKLAEIKPPESAEEVFPLEPATQSFFTRKQLPLSIDELDQLESANTALFVARANALPEDHRYNDDQCVWVSGPESWKKLAKRGVWVSGCNEGMGLSRIQGS